MSIPSIFFNYSYDPNLKEINLTKSLLNVFENSKYNLFLRLIDLRLEFKNFKKTKDRFLNCVSCSSEVHLEEHGRIDAILRMEPSGLFYIECKHGTNKFTKSQLNSYIKRLEKEDAESKFLVLIGSYYPSENFFPDKRDKITILSFTWDDLYDGFDLIKRDLKSDLDIFLLEQFQKYLLEANVVTRRFTNEEAKVLTNPNGLSSISNSFKKSLRLYFDNIKNELINFGFDEKGFNRINYEKSRFGSPTLIYKPPKIGKNRNIYLRFELSDQGKPTFLFEFIENEKNSKFYKNILNNKEFEKKLRKVTFPRLIRINISKEKNNYIFGGYKKLSSFNVTKDLSKFNGKVGFILTDELNSELYETSELFNIVVDAFKQNKFIIDEYL